MLSLLALALSPALPLQTVGGGWDEQRRFLGPADQAQDGGRIEVRHDLNGDGIPDILSASASVRNAFVILRSGKNGQRIAAWTDSAFTGFGQALTTIQDLDGDGRRDVLVGAPAYTNASNREAGAVLGFSSATGTELFRVHGTLTDAEFGASVATIGDLNFDGIEEIVVGLPKANASFGQAVVLSGLDRKVLRLIDGGQFGQFGFRVAAIGDLNADGLADFAVTAPAEVHHGRVEGRVHLYSGRDGSLIRSLAPLSNVSSLGRALANVGDVNLDGVPDLLVVASQNDGSLLYSGANGSILAQYRGMESGQACTACGDLNRDGIPDFAISGAGVVSLIAGGSLQQFGRFEGQWAERFGISIACAGDLNGNGRDELVVGIPFASSDLGTVSYDGAIVIYEFEPQLEASETELSASVGGALGFRINFPVAAAGEKYRLLVSASGDGPMQWGVDVPLTKDPILVQSWHRRYWPAKSHRAHGALDQLGDARPKLVFPAQALHALVGQSLYFAAIAQPAGAVYSTRSSVAVPIAIVP